MKQGKATRNWKQLVTEDVSCAPRLFDGFRAKHKCSRWREAEMFEPVTHSIEVENYGEWIAETLAARLVQRGSLPPDLRTRFVQTVGNACLLHDIGNPPFGHMGEYAIRKWFEENEEHWSTTALA